VYHFQIALWLDEKPIRMENLNKIWLSSPHMGTGERQFLQEAFDTNWVAPVGPHLTAFELEIAKYLNDDVYVAALNSGTSALHLGLVLLGIEKGDEVICQSMTFTATANPVVYEGAIPVFVDSEDDTWNMSPYWLQKAIEKRLNRGKMPKAIIPVHLYGMPCKMDEIMAIANHYNIPVLEDAAEALGSTYFGKQMGTLGDVSVISFNGNKIITTSAGGVLISKDKKLVDRARFLSTQAKDPAPHFEHSTIGYNYRMSNICASIGCGQMQVLPERINRRRYIFDWYKNIFSHIPGITFQNELTGMYSNRWLTAIMIDNKLASDGYSAELLRLHLEKSNIESRPTWKPLHLQPVFKNMPFYGDGTSDRIFHQGLCLPSGSNMTDSDLQRIEKELFSFFQPGISYMEAESKYKDAVA
jgi:dTDP-4-amino-4,6-dideoxygalactose transaminase